MLLYVRGRACQGGIAFAVTGATASAVARFFRLARAPHHSSGRNPHGAEAARTLAVGSLVVCAGQRVDRHTNATYEAARIAEMSNCNRTFSLTMVPPALRRWL